MFVSENNDITDARLNRKVEPLTFPIRGHEDFARLRHIWAERPMVPKLLIDRSEGLDVAFPGRDSRILLSGDESAGRYCLEDVIYAPDWKMPAYHMEESEEYWYVVEGEMEFTVGDLTETCRAGAFAFIPRNTTRAMRNRSGAPVHVLQWSMPAGFDRALQEIARAHSADRHTSSSTVAAILSKYSIFIHDAPVKLANDARVNQKPDYLPFDSNSPEDFARLREMWAPLPMIPKIIHNARQGTRIDVIPNTDTFALLVGDESAGQAMVLDNELPVGLFVPPHYQPTEEEVWYSFDEGVMWRIGGKEIHTKKGSFAFAPRFGTHQFGNPTKGRGRFLSINSPAGHERGLDRMKNTDISLPENWDKFANWGWCLHGER
jgi:mannose-6-phosphate isomerase-like protein (cupin superfamily)